MTALRLLLLWCLVSVVVGCLWAAWRGPVDLTDSDDDWTCS